MKAETLRAIEFRHLRYFIAVAEARNFSRAAIALDTAQPSLSQQIRQLERAIGVDLIDRSKRRIALTAAGIEFLGEARAVVAGLDRAVAHAREAGRGMRGELRIAYTVSAMMSSLPAAIRAFRAGHPEVRLSLAAMSPAEMGDAIRRRDADAGLLLADPQLLGRSPEIAARRLGPLPLGAVVPEDHRLAGRRTIALEDLGGETFILYERRLSSIADAVLALCRARGFAPARVEEVDRIETIFGLVGAGEGVSVVPRLYERLGYSGLAFLTLRPAPPPFVLAVIWSAGSAAPLTAAFVQTCRQIGAIPDGRSAQAGP